MFELYTVRHLLAEAVFVRRNDYNGAEKERQGEGLRLESLRWILGLTGDVSFDLIDSCHRTCLGYNGWHAFANFRW